MIRRTIFEATADWGKDIPEHFFKGGVMLLKDLASKKISKEEFRRHAIYMALHCGFNQLKVRPLPTKPSELLEYDRETPQKKAKVTEDFWRQPAISRYLTTYNKIVQENISNRCWLEEILEQLEKNGDISKAGMVKQRLNEHKDWEQTEIKPHLSR